MGAVRKLGSLAAWAALWVALAAACGGKTDLETTDGGAGTGGTAGASYDTCTLSAECMVRPASCCGDCGAATRSDAVGINKGRDGAYVADNCADTACPACYREQDPTLVAACVSKHCSVVDVRDDSATVCNSNSDCRIRTTSCCECGGETDRAHLVAISNEARFALLVCEGVGACPECAPLYPTDVVARCVDRRCEAVWLTDSG